MHLTDFVAISLEINGRRRSLVVFRRLASGTISVRFLQAFLIFSFGTVGSSAPELFTSLAGVTVDSDVGVGTIVGSAVFNIFIIIAMSAYVARDPITKMKAELLLDWRCFARDGAFYGVSIAFFIGFAYV